MQLPIKNRYSFMQVFWVNLAVYIFFVFLGVIAASIAPVGQKNLSFDNFLSLRNILSQIFSVLYLSVFYFIVVNLFYKLIAARKNSIHFIKIITASFFALGVYFFLYYLISDQKVSQEFNAGLLVFSFTISAIFQVGFALLIPYLTFLRDEKKQRKILEEQKMQLEVEKSQANFNFLKAQINPHFLHNTLNFLYAKSLPYSSELSEGILTLSDIMRYALSPSALKDGKVPLKDEIEHVRNVIKINQLRFSNNLNVQFDVNGVVNGATIIPFILITIVENAFKHGDLKSQQQPIQIKLNVADGVMSFYCRNKKKSGPKEISTGIGLDNIKKQLDLTYGKKYSLHISDVDEFYTTELTIGAI